MHWKRWGKHLAFWIFVLAARYYIQEITFNAFKQYPQGVLLNSFAATVNIAFAYYLMVSWIYPRWLRRKKYLPGVPSLLAVIILYTTFDYATELYMLKDPKWRVLMLQYQPEYFNFLQRGLFNILLSRIISGGILYQLFFGLSLPLFIKVSLEYSREQQRRAELARQNLQLELNFLRSQVDPHFLFNTLNNIYSLILHDKKSESADMVARLSAFMRYSLHEANTGKMPSDKEIELMKDYIGLEKIRLNHIQVTSAFVSDDPSCELPPLLLIPFLENAFKYCPDRVGAFIGIRLSIKDGALEFSCRNTFDPEIPASTAGGIGLNNVRRRLQQYYPESHSYEVSQNENLYSIKLQIPNL
jgi:hypothetical protein